MPNMPAMDRLKAMIELSRPYVSARDARMMWFSYLAAMCVAMDLKVGDSAAQHPEFFTKEFSKLEAELERVISTLKEQAEKKGDEISPGS